MEENLTRAIKGVVVDAGHGGNDPGAVSGNLREKDFNLKAANYMYERFKQLGIPTYITRSTDETLDRDERIKRIMDAFGNDPNVILISNHINSGGGEGAEIIYALRNNDTLARSVLENIGAEGQNMRKYYQRRLPSDPSKDYYFIHRLTGKLQPLLVEYGFIDTPADQRKLENNLLSYAEAVVRAVARYAGVPYTSPEGVPSNVYVVQPGDSLYSIAQKLGTTVAELKSANKLTSNVLQIGQQLIIPTTTPTPPTTDEYVVYIVQPGDTLYKIANKFGVSVNDIIDFNQLGSTVLNVNQQLLIPKEITPPSSQQTYIVQSGDSLYSIAQKFNTTVDKLIEANNLTSSTLQVGQQLTIPGTATPPSENEIEYIVKAGDSLYSIAKKYNTTADELKRYNNLSSNTLQIGQKLLIPNTENYLSYYVKSGDSLYTLAQRFNTTVDELKRLNNLTSNALSIGQLLIIPS